MITLTPRAAQQVRTMLTAAGDAGKKLRVFVETGGCSGFQYGMSLDVPKPDDQEILSEGIAVLLDPTGIVGHAYEAQTTPQMFVIDKAGILRYMGAIDDQPTPDRSAMASARNYVREAFAAVLAGKKVAEPATDSYGCSVKY